MQYDAKQCSSIGVGFSDSVCPPDYPAHSNTVNTYLFYEPDDVKQCSIDVSLSHSVCADYSAHGYVVFLYFHLYRMM